jgi:hypothetical protein
MGINKRTINNIFFKKDFIDNLISVIPQETMGYWDVSIINPDKITGGIRYDNEVLDVIYVIVNCKYQVFLSETVIRFVLDGENFVFDSIYIKYDVKTGLSTSPIEYRYNNNLDVVATYKWNQHTRDYLFSGVLTTQYKDNVKLKEYVLRNDKKVPESFKKLNAVLNLSENIYNNNIDYLSIRDNKELLYYAIY